MRLISFDRFRIGLLVADSVYDVSAVVDPRYHETRLAMSALIADFDRLRDAVERTAEQVEPLALADLRLLPPVPGPTHVFAAPLNYREHIDEMTGSDMVGDAYVAGTPSELGFFLKAPGSLVGASGAIELPDMPDREFHHEAELGVIIGRDARAVRRADGLDPVFGYTCLMDITMRNAPGRSQERVMRKSFETFTPTGPVLVTRDEVPDPTNLGIELSVNGALRQKSDTSLMISSVADLVADASQVLTLAPGDVFATGTPSGVGPIAPGDVVQLTIEQVGVLTMPVRHRSW